MKYYNFRLCKAVGAKFRRRLPFPKRDCVIYPAFRDGACSQAEPVAEAGIFVELGINAEGLQTFQAAFHRAPAGDSVAVADAGIGRRIISGILDVAGILHNDGARLRQVIAAEGSRSVCSQPCGHPCACAAAP